MKDKLEDISGFKLPKRSMKDTDKMPFGKYKGRSLCMVPASYLIRWYEQPGDSFQELRVYIEENMEELEDKANEDAGYGR